MNKPYFELTLVDVIGVIVKWKKIILSVTVLAAVASIIVALMLPVYYKSSALFYPTNLSMTDRSTIFSEKQSEGEFTYYGTKHDANRIISLANSSQIIDFVINHYNLAAHYNYDTASTEYWRTKVKEDFLDNYTVTKTDRDAIEITLYDTDKNLCAEMVNKIVEKIDEHTKKPVAANKEKVRNMLQKQLTEKQQELGFVTDSLISLKKRYAVSTSGSGTQVAFSGNDLIGTEHYKLTYYKQQGLIEDLQKLTTIFNQYDASTKDNISSITVLEAAHPAEKKSKPIRWLICVLSTVLTFGVTSLVALLIEQTRYIKTQI